MSTSSSSSVTVHLGRGKSQLVKAKSSVTLLQILKTVCVKHKIPQPEQYGLKSENIFLDLSLSLHQLNLVSGAKLDLSRLSECTVQQLPGVNVDESFITVMLQLEDGTEAPATQSFVSSTSLWQLLVAFEEVSSRSLNLTKRTGTPQATVGTILRRLSKRNHVPTKVYVQPVVILLQREFMTTPILQSTTLKDVGVTSGNVNVRVSMRHTDIKIENPTDSPARRKSSRKIFSYNNHSNTAVTDNDAAAFQIPTISGRGGAVDSKTREGHLVEPGNGSGSNNGNGEGDGQRQTPSQDINSAMVEANQEIRQLREQQTQEALTDRVKRLSKSSDGTSDKDRFVRGMTLPIIPEPAREDDAVMTEVDPVPMMTGFSTRDSTMMMIMPTTATTTAATSPATTTITASSSTPLPQTQSHSDLVRQIAHRVSQQLREAQQRGEPTLNYHSLIAREIVRGQREGVLPISPVDSRQNSFHAIDGETDPSASTTTPLEPQQSPASSPTTEGKMSFLERARSGKSLPKWMRSLSRKGSSSPSSSSTAVPME